MRAKLVKEVVETAGKFRGKKFYEYSLFTREQLEELTNGYTEQCKKIIQERNEIVAKKPWMTFAPIPPISVPKLSFSDEREILDHHRNENIVHTLKKHNGNFRVYVEDVQMPPKHEPKPEIEEKVEPRKFPCPDCGKVYYAEHGLRMHRSRWCKGPEEAA